MNGQREHDTSLKNGKEPSRGDRSSFSSVSSEQSISDGVPKPKKSSFLPDISHTNKVVQNGGRHKNNGHVPHSMQNGANSLRDDFSDEEADDEQGSLCSEDNFEARRHRRKRKRISKTSTGVYLARRPRPRHSREVEESSPEPDSGESPEPALTGDSPIEKSSEKENREESISEKLAKLQIQYQRRVIDREGRKTIAEELDARARREYRFTEADLDPTIIELQVLERGQYFGITPLLFPDQPSLSVISNGAECLVLSKKLFMQWASEKCLRHVRQTESPYPSDQDLSRKLQEAINWQAQREVIYRQLDAEIQLRKAKRRQFHPSYEGEYCFRTGPI